MNYPTEATQKDSDIMMRSIIQRIATGPELSKDISLDEAREAMKLILDGRANPVQAGIFLIALRMKREADDEYKGVLDALREATHTVAADVDELVDLSDPYDGYNRTLPVAPFLPAVLASFGVPTVSHGVASMGPKYGVTHRQVLKAAGLPVDLSPEQAAARLTSQDTGWAYVDQKDYCPKLHALTDLRTLIVKRPVLTTVETLIGPIRGRKKTHLVSGYVHKPYARIYAMLARYSGFDSALLVRGVEGGVIPSLRQTGRFFYYRDGGQEEYVDVDPIELGIKQEVRAAPLPDNLPKTAEQGDEIAVTVDAVAVAQAAAQAGQEALQGKPGPVRDGLVYAAAACLWNLRRYDSLLSAVAAVRERLDSGKVSDYLR